WGHAEIWYPGYMMVRSRTATRLRDGARLTMISTPEGRTTYLAQGVSIIWPPGLPGATARATTSGARAQVEVSFDASPDSTYTFTQFASVLTPKGVPLTRVTHELWAAQTRGYDSLAADNA